MKTANTFGIQFVIRANKKDPSISLIYARLTVNGKRIEISLKRTIGSTSWNYSKECVKGTSVDVKQHNQSIEEARFKLRECYMQLQVQGKHINAEAIKNLFLGETRTENTLCSLIDYHNVHMKGVLAAGTLKNYFTTKKYVKLFLRKRFKADDIYLSELNYQFITEFEFFLRTIKPLAESNPLGNNGIMKHIERLKKIARLGVMMEWLPKHPFERFKLRFQKSEREILIKEELALIENFSFSKAKFNKARDLFIFSCYTGLAYVDLAKLTSSNICLGMDGEYWIKTFRQKTEVPVNVPLLPQAMAIIKNFYFGWKSNRVCNTFNGEVPCNFYISTNSIRKLSNGKCRSWKFFDIKKIRRF
jgi:integrase